MRMTGSAVLSQLGCIWLWKKGGSSAGVPGDRRLGRGPGPSMSWAFYGGWRAAWQAGWVGGSAGARFWRRRFRMDPPHARFASEASGANQRP